MNHYSWTLPYPSRRSPLFAENVVATSHPLAAEAGLSMMRRGGNAVDAALAAAITLTVVEPTGCGIGSDVFALVWDRSTLHGLNGSGRSPRHLDTEGLYDQGFIPETGWDTVTVPGAVDAWATLSQRFGKLPFEALFPPALEYARKGYLVTPIIAAQWKIEAKRYRSFPSFRETFLPRGRSPLPGERFFFPHIAPTLEEIARTHGDAFYRGALAERIIAHACENGGPLTGEDLDAHRSLWVDPLTMSYGDVTVHELPPNGQGLAALIALGILNHCHIGDYPVDSVEGIHCEIEAMKCAFSDVVRHVADPEYMSVTPDALIDSAYLAEKAAGITMDRARIFPDVMPPDGGTVYCAAADADGMMVSFIQSNFRGFGSGVVIPKTGISLQGRGAGFTLDREHPNGIAGGKRPFHTIIPAFVTKDNTPLICFGVMGAHMQPQGHVQVLRRMIDYNQNPQTASDAPRWHIDRFHRLSLEPGFPADIADGLSRRGHVIVPPESPGLFGGAQIIASIGAGYCAGSDHRKDGQAVGF